MRVTGSLLALALVLGVGISCKLAERLGGDKNAGTVSTLWSDVPPFEGATKADLEIPLGARLIIRAFSQGAVNFISFRTSKTAQEVSGSVRCEAADPRVRKEGEQAPACGLVR